jgi:hypothetical protein
MNQEAVRRFLNTATINTGNTLLAGGGAALLTVSQDETFFSTDYAGRNTPRSLAHMALTLLRQAQDDLISQDQSKPLDHYDEVFLSDLADIISDLEFYADPEATS